MLNFKYTVVYKIELFFYISGLIRLTVRSVVLKLCEQKGYDKHENSIFIFRAGSPGYWNG